jgi:hypothetical protein
MAADGVVFDQITGLLWQASLPDAYTGCTGLATSTPGGTCSWDEAVRYCEQLQLAQRRWRLPSLVELVSLLDHRNSAELVRPMLDEAAFPRPPEDIAFWTATTLGAYAADSDRKSRVDFWLGRDTSTAKSTAGVVRCVHSEHVRHAPPDRFVVDQGMATVRDTATELEWQLGPARAAASWDEAQAYCASSQRRVPTVKELYTLLDLGRDNPPITHWFEEPDLDRALYSATLGRFGLRFFLVPLLGSAFLQSEVDDPANALRAHVRCVR